jgi:hypothetical protein
MSKKRKHSSCSLKDKLKLLKRTEKSESATKLAFEFGAYFFYILFGLARLYCIINVGTLTFTVLIEKNKISGTRYLLKSAYVTINAQYPSIKANNQCLTLGPILASLII